MTLLPALKANEAIRGACIKKVQEQEYNLPMGNKENKKAALINDQ